MWFSRFCCKWTMFVYHFSLFPSWAISTIHIFFLLLSLDHSFSILSACLNLCNFLFKPDYSIRGPPYIWWNPLRLIKKLYQNRPEGERNFEGLICLLSVIRNSIDATPKYYLHGKSSFSKLEEMGIVSLSNLNAHTFSFLNGVRGSWLIILL